MIIVFFMNLIVLVSAYLLTYKLFAFRRLIDSCLAFFIFYFGQIIVTQTFLGIAGRLNLKNVILLNSVLCVVIWLAARGKKSSFSTYGLREGLRDFFSNKIVLFAVAFMLGFGIVKIAINLINPPCGWDDISYHLVFPVEWLKSGNLNTPISICDDPSTPYYPINGNLFFLWFMFPLSNVFLADLGQVPFFLIAFFAIYAICRKLDLTKELSFYAAALFLITPNVFKQLEISYVDVMVAALFLGALNFLLALTQEFSYRHLIAWSVYVGAFLGTKTSAILYGGLLIIFFVFLLVANLLKEGRAGKISVYFLIFVSLAILLGGYSYIRNYLLTGNPLFPADITLLGRKVFKGVMPFSTYRAHWTPGDFNLKKFLFGEGMGGQFLIFVLPSLLVSIPLAFQALRKSRNPALSFMYMLPILLYLVFMKFMPQYWVRYLYPFLGAGYIVSMLAVQHFNIPRILLKILIFACVVGSVAELCGHFDLFCSMMLSIMFFFLLPFLTRIRLRLISLTFGAAFLLILFSFLNRDYDKHEFERYVLGNKQYMGYLKDDRLAWKWVNDHTKNSRIAYTGIPHMLPLYGTLFKNDVLYVSVNKVHPAQLHNFTHACYTWDTDYLKVIKGLERQGNFRENPDYSTWRKNLLSENIEYLVVYSFRRLKNAVFPFEDDWAQSHPGDFDLAYRNDAVHIFRLRR